MTGVARGDKKGYTASVAGKSNFVMENAYSNLDNYVEFFVVQNEKNANFGAIYLRYWNIGKNK